MRGPGGGSGEWAMVRSMGGQMEDGGLVDCDVIVRRRRAKRDECPEGSTCLGF